MHVQIHKAKTNLLTLDKTYLQNFIPTFAGVFAYDFMPVKVEIKSFKYAKERFTYLYMYLS